MWEAASNWRLFKSQARKNSLKKKKTKLNSSPERNMEDLEDDPYWGNRQLFKGELLNFGVA